MIMKAISRILMFIFLGTAIMLAINSYLLTTLNNKELSNNDNSPTLLLQNVNQEEYCIFGVKNRALLASRFKNLTHLQTVVSIQYDKNYSKMDSIDCLNSVVRLSYLSNGEKINRTMTSGVSQDDILQIQNDGYLKRALFILTNPNAIRQRKELEKIYLLSRRRPFIFGPADVAFCDLAEATLYHINTPNLAFVNYRDSSEKGYINTFNHITAQAIITSFYSEELADFIGDLHERSNMPEITSGRFSENQLIDSLQSPDDNYIDIINNEIGQKIGLKLKYKYKLNENSKCSPILLAALLNDVQSYYMWALEIGLDNFRPTDEIVIKFANKFNSL